MFLQTLIDFINSNGVVVGIVTLLLGLLVGYWLRIEGDKRKENQRGRVRIKFYNWQRYSKSLK